jgi:methyl-accepting chemotaxis protein
MKRKIRTSLIAAFMIPIAFIILLGVISYAKASEAIIDNYKKATMNTVSQTGQYYQLLFQTLENKSLEIASNSNTRDYYGGIYAGDTVKEQTLYEQFSRSLQQISMADENINLICVMAPTGKAYTTTGTIMAGAYEEYEASKEGQAMLASTEPYWSGYHYFLDEKLYVSQQDYAISLTRDIVDNYSNPIGILTMDIKAESLQKPLIGIEMPSGSLCAFVGPDGREVTKDGISKESIFVDSGLYQEALSSAEETGMKYTQYNGTAHIFLYAKVGYGNGVFCTLVPEAIVTEQADDIKSITVLVVVIASIIAIIVAIMIANGIGSTIRKINKAVSQAEEGDLTVKLTTKRKDEFRQLTGHVSGMLAGMKGLIHQTASVSAAVANAAEDVAQSSGELVKFSEGISASIAQMEEALSSQAEDAVVCQNKMAYLDDKIMEAGKSTEQIAILSENTKQIIANSIVTVDELGQRSMATADITREVIVGIEELEKESIAIGGIVETINSIADQTNLLSLNASIEAARVGVAGRGFAVVADEIRKLAEESVLASTKIGQIVLEIQRRTKDTVGTAKKAEETVTMQGGALNSTVKAFSDISKHVENLTVNIGEITEKLQDIASTKNETVDAITNITAVLEETSATSEEVDAAAKKQLSSAEKLNSEAIQLGEEALELKAAICRFKV